MEVTPTVHNLAASIVSDSRYNTLRVFLYENLNVTSAFDSAAESHGAFIGLVRSFKTLEEWAEAGKAAKLKEYQISQEDLKKSEEPIFTDVDMER